MTMTPRILPAAEHLITYHLLTAGTCVAGLVGEEPVEMVPGDAIIFPHGDGHVLSSARGVRVRDDLLDTTPDRFPSTVRMGDDARRPGTTFFCGFLGCDSRPFNPLIAALPRRMHMRGISNPWLGRLIGEVSDQARVSRPGADCVLTRLAEVMFIEAVRRHLDELPAGQLGWLAGLRDETVGRALTQLHASPGHPWTLEELAHASHASRTNLARRFTALVGQPPMTYLTQWRMQVAANELVRSGAKVGAIATEVGYESEAAFSRAFKKATGSAPGAWRNVRRTVRA
jgi:AraC-like DNA-binding protein